MRQRQRGSKGVSDRPQAAVTASGENRGPVWRAHSGRLRPAAEMTFGPQALWTTLELTAAPTGVPEDGELVEESGEAVGVGRGAVPYGEQVVL